MDMKIVQVGILIALVVVGALLFLVWRGQQQPSETAVVTSEQPPAVTPEQAAPPPSAETPIEPGPAAASPVKTAKKPSAAPAWKPATQTPTPAALPAAQTPSVTPAAPSTPAPAPATESKPPVAAPPPPRKVTLEAGTLIPARLSETLDSSKMQVGDTFQAALDQPLVVEGLVIAERGARLTGKVAEVQQAGRVKGLSAIAVELVQFTTSDGQKVNVQTAAFRKEAEKTTKKDAAKVGIGAGVGAAIGAIAGGGKGAAIGAGVGGAAGTGTVLATRGQAAVLPVETKIEFRLSAPVTITEKR
jgi:hypothetical protein